MARGLDDSPNCLVREGECAYESEQVRPKDEISAK